MVHVSAEGVIPILEAARAERIKGGYMGWRGGVTAETCNHYLTLSSEMIPPGHSEFKCAPPIRNITNKVTTNIIAVEVNILLSFRRWKLRSIQSVQSPEVKNLN